MSYVCNSMFVNYDHQLPLSPSSPHPPISHSNHYLSSSRISLIKVPPFTPLSPNHPPPPHYSFFHHPFIPKPPSIHNHHLFRNLPLSIPYSYLYPHFFSTLLPPPLPPPFSSHTHCDTVITLSLLTRQPILNVTLASSVESIPSPYRRPYRRPYRPPYRRWYRQNH